LSATVHLVRHARHGLLDLILVGRMADVSLSHEGRLEAAGLAARFVGMKAPVVQSSPRQRARETAEPVAAAVGAAVEVVPALDEIDFGHWTGCSFETLKSDPRWHTWNSARSTARPPAGESMMEAQQRVVGHLEGLGRTLGDRAAVLVSHGDVIKAALLHIMGRPVDDYGEIDVAPASVSTIEIGSDGPRLVAVACGAAK
jgi:probable phosphoglycerate mutase